MPYLGWREPPSRACGKLPPPHGSRAPPRGSRGALGTFSGEPRRSGRGYLAVRAGAGAAGAAGFAFRFAARSSSQMVIGAAMNQVE